MYHESPILVVPEKVTELSLKIFMEGESVKNKVDRGCSSGIISVRSEVSQYIEEEVHIRSIIEDKMDAVSSSALGSISCDIEHEKEDSFIQKERQVRKKLIAQFLQTLLKEKVFSFNYMKRLIAKELRQRGFLDVSVEEKPDGLDVEAMFDNNIIISGACPLVSTAHELNIDNITKEHIYGCLRCAGKELHPSCYFNTLQKCLINGWSPPVDTGNISRAYGDNDNHHTVSSYSKVCEKGINKMVSDGVLLKVSNEEENAIITPFKAVVKNSSLISARVHTGINIHNDVTLDMANILLTQLGHAEVKVRMTSNCSASGVNRATPDKPFSYPSIQQALQNIYKGCWLGKGDIKSYFWCYPLANEVLNLFLVKYKNVSYVYTRCPFGFKLCPYYCSTWSAEIRKWMLRRNIKCSHMVDDWLVVGDTKDATLKDMSILSETLINCGFKMADEKYEYGQQLVYVGILIDTVKMVLRFDAVQSRGFQSQLKEYILKLKQGRHVDAATIHHVCGKLEWYSEVVQSGRIKSQSWWHYLHAGLKLSQSKRLQLIKDTEWWINLLSTWSENNNSGKEYPIISSIELSNNLQNIMVVQSDMSGPDGIGYYTYNMESPEVEIEFFSQKWNIGYTPSSSMLGELLALEQYLQKSRTSLNKCILVWVTDSMSSAWAILKGRCRELESLAILSHILDLCDEYSILLLALWVPREQNELADFLSHLSVIVNRQSVGGSGSELDGILRESHRSNIY